MLLTTIVVINCKKKTNGLNNICTLRNTIIMLLTTIVVISCKKKTNVLNNAP